jgi:predicted PurR-regulated permease PerM
MKLLRKLVFIALLALVAAVADVPWPFPAPVFYGVLLITLAAISYGRVHKRPPIEDWRSLVQAVLAGLGIIGLACLMELLEGLTGAEILKSLTFTFPTGKPIYTPPGLLLIGYMSLGFGAMELIRKATIPRVR